MHPLLRLSATDLAARIRARDVTSREVVQHHVDRIRAVNPRINALVCQRFDAALAEADAADARVATGDTDLPPLHGVPCSIKEAFAVTGMPWTGGLKARTGLLAKTDAVSVQRLRHAGAIVVGVTNVSELCMWMESDNPVYGRTHNPYDASRTAGGSSGGEGAIVGAGGTPFGLGADVGGSIRMPAFFNGVFGHKPGTGVVPNSGQFPNASDGGSGWMLSTGPICRRSADLMPLLRILAGPDGEDTFCRDTALGAVGDVRIEDLRVLDVPGNGAQPVDPRLRAAQERVAEHLRARGADVRLREFPTLKASFDIWSTALGGAEGSGAFRKLMQREGWHELLPHLVRPAELGGAHTLPAVILGLVEDVGSMFPRRTAHFRSLREDLRHELIEAIGPRGVMLFPSYPTPAPKHREPWLRPFSWVYTAIFNALGFPVTQVPLGLDGRGLPLGVQVVGVPGSDHVTIAVAEALERDGVAGWVPPPE